MPFQLMGILNVTPDSFYDGGRYCSLSAALKQSERMIEEGAHILDVGGESSRPGARTVSVEEEKHRVLPIIRALAKRYPKIKISVDTTKSEVARSAIGEGATILNDISALNADLKMLEVAQDLKPTLVLMHMQGTPKTMQKNPRYLNVVAEIKLFLKKRMEWLNERGILNKKIWIDPGIGFGKSVEHNLEILNRLKEFRALGVPVLVGCSRKSFIGKVLGQGKELLKLEERLEGSIAAACWAYLNGATILRVHDVMATKKALHLIEAIQNS